MESMRDKRSAKMILFMGRVLSGMALVVFVFQAITNPPELSKFSTGELLLFIPFLVMVGGLIAGMFRQGTGALLLMIGYVVYVLMNYMSNGTYWIHWFFFVFPLIGIIYLMAWNKSKPIDENDSSTQPNIQVPGN